MLSEGKGARTCEVSGGAVCGGVGVAVCSLVQGSMWARDMTVCRAVIFGRKAVQRQYHLTPCFSSDSSHTPYLGVKLII